MPPGGLHPDAVRERSSDWHAGTALEPGMERRPSRRPRMEATSRAGNDQAASQKRQFTGRTTQASTDRSGAGTAPIHDVSALPAPSRREWATLSRSISWCPWRLTTPAPLWKPREFAAHAPQPAGPLHCHRGEAGPPGGPAHQRLDEQRVQGSARLGGIAPSHRRHQDLVWMPPGLQGNLLSSVHLIECVLVSGLNVRPFTRRWPVW